MLLCPVVSGCCGAPAPRAEKFFDRSTPAHAVRMLRYAVEAEQWDAVHACMTEAWREQNSQTAMALAIQYGTWSGHTIEEWIVEAEQYDGWQVFRPGGDPTREYAAVILEVIWPEEFLVHALWLEREGDEWRVAIDKDPAAFITDGRAWPPASPFAGLVRRAFP